MRGEGEILREIGNCVGDGVYVRAEGTAHRGGRISQGRTLSGRAANDTRAAPGMYGDAMMRPVILDANLKVK